MAVVSSIVALITANNEQFKRKMKESGDAVDKLKSQFGARSGLKDAFEIFKGAGAIVGLTFALNSLRDMAAGLADIEKRVREAGTGWRGFVSEIGRTIPVTKQTIEILELLTGVTARREALKSYANDVLAMKDALEELHASTGRAAATLESIIVGARESLRLGSVFGVERQALQSVIEYERKLRDIEKAQKDANAAADRFLETTKTIFAAGSILGGVNVAEEMAAMQKRLAASRAKIAEDLIRQEQMQKLGNALSETVAASIAGGIETGFDIAEKNRKWAEKWKRFMQTTIQDAMRNAGDAIGDFWRGGNRPEVIRQQARFAPIGDSGSGPQLLAMEMARLQIGGDNPQLRTQKEIRDDLRAIKNKLDR